MLKITLAFINHLKNRKTIPSSRKEKSTCCCFTIAPSYGFYLNKNRFSTKKNNHNFEIGLFLLFLAISINQKVKSEQVLFVFLKIKKKVKGGFFKKNKKWLNFSWISFYSWNKRKYK